MKYYSHLVFIIFIFLFSSSGVIYKFLGLIGLIIYILFISLVYIAQKHLLLKKKDLQPKFSFLITFFLIIILFVLFVFIYPAVNVPEYFSGSDSDDALNIASSELLKGNFPYYNRTYLENDITQMPGALFLAVPLYILFGNVVFQNFFWIILFAVFLFHIVKSQINSVFLLLLSFVFTPLIPYHIFTGSDYIANSIYVLLSLYLLHYFIDSKKEGLISYIAAFFAGFCLSSRPVFFLLLPVIFLFLLSKYNFKTAYIHTGVIITGFLIVTLPFFFYDVSGFSPLHTVYKLSRFNNILPYSEIFIPILSISGGLAYILLSRKRHNFEFLMMGCFIVLFIPVFSGFLLSSIESGSVNFGYTYFSTFFIFFAVLPLWERIQDNMFHADTADKKNKNQRNQQENNT